jgi:hypothetical protein
MRKNIKNKKKRDTSSPDYDKKTLSSHSSKGNSTSTIPRNRSK